MTLQVANNAFGELNADINTSVTTIVLKSGNGARFPSLAGSQYFYATLIDTNNNLEIVKATARSSDTLTVVRAQDGTSARSFVANDRLELRPVAAFFDTYQQKESSVDMNGTELILDADADTSITADTDDQIDIRINGSDQIKLASDEVVFNEQSINVDFRVESNGNTHMFFVDGGNDKVMIGLETPDVFNGTTPPLQIEGTDNNKASLSITRNSNDNGQPLLILSKSRGTAVNSDTIVQNNDVIGEIVFLGADGNDRNSQVASIQAVVNGTPGSNDMPGALSFRTTADGAATATERMKIDTAGNVNITDGNLVVANGHGIDFSAKSGDASGMAAELFDDYEEGMWDATLTPQTSGSTTVNSDANNCQYTKIGRMVFLSGLVQVGSVSSPVGVLRMSGLPFAVANLNDYGGRTLATINIQAGAIPPNNYGMWFSEGDSFGSIYNFTSSEQPQATASNNFGGNESIYFSVMYRTS